MRMSDWSSDVCSSDLRVWVATENGGLSVLDRARSGFRHYRKADHPQMGSDDVFAITSRGDDIWFGNYAGGLHHLAADGSITRYTHDQDDPDRARSTVQEGKSVAGREKHGARRFK